MDTFVPPAYHSRSLSDIVPAIARALGRPVQPDGTPSPLILPEASGYVLFLVDGLGYELLLDHAEEAPYLASLVAGSQPATASVPSTTATSLTTLGTGLLPGTHGMVGYTSRIPGTHELLNALTWNKTVDPDEWQPHPSMFQRLASAGIEASVINKREFAGSGLTIASQRGARFVGADKFGERMVALQSSVAQQPSFTYLYDGDLDWTGHRYGVDSPQWRSQLGVVDTVAQHVRNILPTSVRLVVIADHGMVDSPELARLDIDDHPELREGVVLVGGEARFRHLYCQSGAVADVQAAWLAGMSERAEVLTREEAVARGWFGELAPQVRPRIGDVVVACRDDFAVLCSSAFPKEGSLVGLHGSLTSTEMLVPLLVD